MMTVLSYVFNVLGIALMILSSLVKGKRMEGILVLLCAGNLFLGVGYLLAGSGINGSVTSFIGCVLTLINYFFQRKNKPIPVWLNIVYGVVLITVNILVGGWNLFTLIVVLACIAFILGVFQKSGKGYRIFTLCNILFWCLYDLATKTYSALISHSVQFLFALIGILLNDILKFSFSKDRSETNRV